MTNEMDEMMLDLVTKKATYGLDEAEQATLDSYYADAGIADDTSFEIAAAAIGLVGLKIDEQLPAHLQTKIIASADDYFATLGTQHDAVSLQANEPEPDLFQKTFTYEPTRRSWSWLGWALAGAACIALAINVWTTRFTPVEIGGPKPPEAPVKLTPEQEMAELLASGNAIIKANWSAGNVKALNNISGDVVWSDEKQKGYMRFRGLPVNDKNKETYQLWIFDKTQDKATPIDGGTFDVDQNGEVVIPINAKLKTREPGMFAVTVEKPGGVVVSKREKVAALATVVVKAGSNT